MSPSAPIMRRFRAVTTADVLTLRYDQSVAVLFALVGIANMALKIGVLLKGAGALVDSCTGGTIDANLALAMITVLSHVWGDFPPREGLRARKRLFF